MCDERGQVAAYSDCVYARVCAQGRFGLVRKIRRNRYRRNRWHDPRRKGWQFLHLELIKAFYRGPCHGVRRRILLEFEVGLNVASDGNGRDRRSVSE